MTLKSQQGDVTELSNGIALRVGRSYQFATRGRTFVATFWAYRQDGALTLEEGCGNWLFVELAALISVVSPDDGPLRAMYARLAAEYERQPIIARRRSGARGDRKFALGA